MPGPRSKDDGGFTMVELVVSLSVMAIGVIGAMSVFNSSFAVAGQASIRSRAVSLATREIEAFRAVPYDELAVTGQTASRDERFGGVLFTVEHAITAADTPTVSGAYKQGTVSVSWTDHGGPHSIDQTTLLYPGGLGPRADATATTTTVVPSAMTPQLPGNPTAIAPEATDAEFVVELAWTMTDESHLAGFAVRYTSGSSTVVVTDTLPAGSRTLRVTGLSAATTYAFEIGSRPTTGVVASWAAIAPITTSTAPTEACVIGTPAIDPARVVRKPPNGGGTLVANPSFSVNTSGSCVGLRIAYRRTKHSDVVSRALPGTSGLRTLLLEDVPLKWDSGIHPVDLFDGNGTRRATVTLLVCDNVNACR